LPEKNLTVKISPKIQTYIDLFIDAEIKVDFEKINQKKFSSTLEDISSRNLSPLELVEELKRIFKYILWIILL